MCLHPGNRGVAEVYLVRQAARTVEHEHDIRLLPLGDRHRAGVADERVVERAARDRAVGLALRVGDDMVGRLGGVVVGGRTDEEKRRRGGDRETEENTSESQSLMRISYDLYCLQTLTNN